MANDDDRETSTDLMSMDDDAQIIRTDPTTLSALNRSEVEAQLDAAHRYPRVLSVFRKNAVTLATATPEIAKSCMYTLERKDKDGTKIWIVGPSIRLAGDLRATYKTCTPARARSTSMKRRSPPRASAGTSNATCGW